MGTVFLDGQNAGHIGQRHIVLVLEPCAQEIQILRVRLCIVRVFPKQAIPFVDQDDEGALGLRVDVLHHLNQVLLIAKMDLYKPLQQVKAHILLQHAKHFRHGARGAEELLHIDFDDVVLV